MSEKDMFYLCVELAEIIIKENDAQHSAYLIQFFVDEMGRGETPTMALGLAKKFRAGKIYGEKG